MRATRVWLGTGVSVEAASLVVLGSRGASVGAVVGRTLLAVGGVAVVLWALHSRSMRFAAWLAWAYGIVGVAIGLGVGPRHIVSGSSVVAVAGMAALVSAATVTVVASVLLIRMAHGWRRVWAVPVALGSVILLLPSVIAVAASSPPPTPLTGRSPADVGLEAETVEFAARDGTVLEGWWVPSRNGAAVVVLHGSGSNRSSVVDHMAVLADAGYGVLAFDARGHGTSEGDPMDLGWTGADDLIGALDHVAVSPTVDPTRIGAFGLSMGGEEALTAIGDARLRAVVAEGATRRAASDDGWLPSHPGGVLQRWMDRWQDATVRLLTGLEPPPSLRSSVASGSTPVLLVAAGTVDDEQLAASWIAAGAPDRVEVWVVPGAIHTGGLATDRVAWTATVLGFLDRTLRPAGG